MRLETSNKTYVHYGSKAFDPKRFVPIRNALYRNKPTGGLWASPINEDGMEEGYGWRTFWADQSPNEESDEVDNVEFLSGGRYSQSFRFKLKEGRKVLMLHTKKDIEGIPCVRKPVEMPLLNEILPDFEKLRNTGVAAIEYSPDELYMDLYGWDVECLLVLDPDAVVEVKE